MAALTPVASVEALVSAIEKSGLVAAGALDKVREAAAKASDPKVLARDLIKDGTLTRWQAEQLINGYHRLLIGRYKLLDQIGTAPTGRLYLVEHTQMGRRHTLKVLAKRLASNPVAVKQFLTSAQNACGLDHRNISHVYDVNQDRIGHYVVMEHVEGQDLEQLVERTGRVKLAQALDFIGQVAEGLAHAHANGVVHGDLKPSNLLRDHSGTIKILEIGQAGTGARPEIEGPDESVETASLAAVIFQAPELRGDGEAADIACDVYSLGSVLCFLLTGKAAKDSTAAVKLLEAIVEIPPEVVALCRRLMADEPAERLASMEEVLVAISAVARQVAAAAKAKPEANGLTDSAVRKKEKWKQPAESLPKTAPPATSALAENQIPPIVVASGEQSVASVEAPVPFVIKTRERISKMPRGKMPKVPAARGASENTDSTWLTNSAHTSLVLAGAIGGGGVLLLGLGVALVCVLAFSPSDRPLVEANKPAAAVVAENAVLGKPVEAESSPAAAAAETNPEEVAATPVQADAPAIATALPASPVEEAKAPQSSAPTAGSSTGNETPTTAKAIMPVVTPLPTTPEPKPAPTPLSATTAPKQESGADPFKGFAKAVSLPPLPDEAEAMPPTALGPCKVDDKTMLALALLGGETAIRATRQKFELQPKGDKHRDWDVVVAGGGSPIAIAALSAKDGGLMFQWTEDGVQQAALAKQLCNCALALGTSRQVVALREAAFGAPLVVEIEKPGAAVKWNIGDLPVAKQVFIDVTRTDGFKRLRQDPKGPTSVGDTVIVGTGPAEKSIPLLLKLTTSSTANTIDVRLQPIVKLEGWSEGRPYRRKDLLALQQQSSQELTRLTAELRKSKDSRPRTDPEKEAKDATIKRLANELAAVNTVLDQLRFVIDFMGSTESDAKIHFRVYSHAGDTKIDLLKTENDLQTENTK